MQEAAVENSKKMGVFCLAEPVDSVLMWSHYGSNHRGIAIEFDFRRDLESSLLPLWKIHYQEERPVVTDIYEDKPVLPLADALAIKANFWSYEKEWRAMKPDQAGESIGFDPIIITGMFLGAKCSVEDEKSLRSLVSQHDCKVRRMKPDQITFKLIVVEP